MCRCALQPSVGLDHSPVCARPGCPAAQRRLARAIRPRSGPEAQADQEDGEGNGQRHRAGPPPHHGLSIRHTINHSNQPQQM